MAENFAILDQIRSQTARVASRATSVRVREDRLIDYAGSLPISALAAPALDPESHFIGDENETIAFFLMLDAINFGSGYFPHLSKLPGKSGYFTVATRLTGHFRAYGPIDAEHLVKLDTKECRAIFQQQSDGGPVDELMSLFARALNDLGKVLRDDFAGDFAALVRAANHSAEALVALLARMPMFRDVQRYEDFDVPFYKRAQLTAADLNLALAGKGLGKFDDLNRLTIFADNLVPHVLRCDGVLEYSPELARQIDAGELIPANSREEIEIRASAVSACERIGEILRSDGHSITAMQIDYLLWNRGQQPEYKARPRHRARTWFY